MVRRSRSRKSLRARHRVLRSESLEPRTLLSGNSFWSLAGLYSPAAMVGARAPANAAPAVAQPISVNGNASITGKTASLSVLGRDDAPESKLVYQWSVTAAPAGGNATFSLNGTNAAKKTTVTFTKAGTYSLTVKIVDAGGLSVNSTVKGVVVSSTLTSLGVRTATGQVVTAGSTLMVSGVSQALVACGLDQFGNAVSGTLAASWSTTSLPSGASAPIFTTSGGVTTVTFGMAGSYTLGTAMSTPKLSCVTKVLVNQTLTSIILSPNAPSVLAGATQQFTPAAFDQFHRLMVNSQTFTWSASSGTVSNSGLFTAPGSAATCTVSAKSGSVTGTATATIMANSGNFQNAALAQLVQRLDADGSINRQDMLQIFSTVEADGVVDAGEFADLKQILSQATKLNIPGYVQVLAGDVINGNAANATFQGQKLGNLAAGSSAAQLSNLVGKWFLGTDHPALCNTSLVYKTTAGSLFPHSPSHADEVQGMLGDCYFISAMGTLADSNPAAVQNMFIDNGDGTFTVRFYAGSCGTQGYVSDGGISAGFKDNNVTADYVTVDRMLPAGTTGILAYADYGSNVANAANSLWIPLAEKAYAQWNQTGKEGRDGLNAYASIQGGWMATVDAQVLGHNAEDYIMTNTNEQIATAALAAHKAVTIGTLDWTGTVFGLYADHAYAIVGYNASTDTFTLYNPWGSNQPGPLKWSQLQAATSQMAVADTSGSIPIAGAAVRAGLVKLSASLVDVAMASDAV